MAVYVPVKRRIKLKYEEKEANVRLGKDFTPQNTLDAVHKRIVKTWNLDRYTLSMKHTSFAMDDVAAFTQLWKTCQTQIVLRVDPLIPVMHNPTTDDIEQKYDSFNLNVTYGKAYKRFAFPLDTTSWTDDMLSNLKRRIMNHFKIQNQITLCEDTDGQEPIDDIDDLKTAFDEIEGVKDDQFTFTLYVAVDPSAQPPEEKEQKEKPKVNKTKLISECFTNELDQILQFHEMTFQNIFNDIQCVIRKNDID
eukprot:804876_1